MICADRRAACWPALRVRPDVAGGCWAMRIAGVVNEVYRHSLSRRKGRRAAAASRFDRDNSEPTERQCQAVAQGRAMKPLAELRKTHSEKPKARMLRQRAELIQLFQKVDHQGNSLNLEREADSFVLQSAFSAMHDLPATANRQQSTSECSNIGLYFSSNRSDAR